MSEVMRELERRVLLSVLDRKWREHLYEMDYLREGIGLRAYSQRDPLVEYQREGYDMFSTMMDGIKEESVGFLFNLEVQVDESDASPHPPRDGEPVDGRRRPLLDSSAPAVRRHPGGRAAPADPRQGARPVSGAARADLRGPDRRRRRRRRAPRAGRGGRRRAGGRWGQRRQPRGNAPPHQRPAQRRKVEEQEEAPLT